MGKIAQEKSDFQIITNDNPRNEDPKKIVAQIVKDMHLKNFDIIFDRKEAISEGLKNLRNWNKNQFCLLLERAMRTFKF